MRIALCKNAGPSLSFAVIDRFLSSCLSVQFGNKAVAQAACDVFQLLISYWERLQRFDPSLPKKIIEVTHMRAQVSLSEDPESISIQFNDVQSQYI